jgi:hypothetical protein
MQRKLHIPQHIAESAAMRFSFEQHQYYKIIAASWLMVNG